MTGANLAQYDTSGDSRLSAIDALLVINYLNSVQVSIAGGDWRAATFHPANSLYEYEWNAAAFSDGTLVTVEAEASDSSNNRTTATAINVTAGQLDGQVHVADLDGYSVESGRLWEANVTVTVVDAQDAPVAGAIVSGIWSGIASGSVAATTGADGQVTVTSELVRDKRKAVVFTVDNIALSGYSYDPAANTDPDGPSDSDGTTISVVKADTLASSQSLATLRTTQSSLPTDSTPETKEVSPEPSSVTSSAGGVGTVEIGFAKRVQSASGDENGPRKGSSSDSGTDSYFIGEDSELAVELLEDDLLKLLSAG